ncbi:hypothetical protein LEAN103870_08175 [Legionella anisa]|uniref:Uncharacterized protein n=2 Tax=Legionella anisa TaxID=28082 RepID=A0AAX0WQC1_9GAMM|nr:hypothetical protein DLD14_04710 [Legionella anisa]KTC69472.1 hypothetical protein Lani_2661 [Legionella anisa]PNL60315.1 hypothetical protein A6J39_003300 [Legionella anisa]
MLGYFMKKNRIKENDEQSQKNIEKIHEIRERLHESTQHANTKRMEIDSKLEKINKSSSYSNHKNNVFFQPSVGSGCNQRSIPGDSTFTMK